MTLLYIDGFDHLDPDLVHYNYPPYKTSLLEHGSGALDNQLGWVGVGKCLEFLGDNTYSGAYSYSIPASATVIVGMAYKSSHPLASPSSVDSLIRLRRGSADQLDLAFNGSNYLMVRRGASVILGTSSRPLPHGTWLFIEFKATIHDSSGSFEVRVDGETILSGDSADTKALTDDDVTTVAIGDYGSVGYKTYRDDLYICNSSGSVNNDFLGGVQIHTLRPNGDGSYHEWSPATANNYTYVDEQILQTTDTDNVSTSTDNAIDAYAFETLSNTPSAIKGVQLNVVAKRSSIQNRNIQLLTRISSNNYLSGTQALRSTDRVQRHVMETNPATGTAWTKAVIDDAQFGMKAV